MPGAILNQSAREVTPYGAASDQCNLPSAEGRYAGEIARDNLIVIRQNTAQSFDLELVFLGKPQSTPLGRAEPPLGGDVQGGTCDGLESEHPIITYKEEAGRCVRHVNGEFRNTVWRALLNLGPSKRVGKRFDRRF
ncbi:hypothetical protein ATER59S_05306 [Aquamicrobium terrae]